MAEASHVGVVPHNPLSVVSTAACLQIAATASTFVLQELPATTWSDVRDTRPASTRSSTAPLHTTAPASSRSAISDAPGIGVTLRPDATKRFPYRPRAINTRRHIDGSAVDQ